MDKEIVTLQDLIYGLRDTIGQVKDKCLECLTGGGLGTSFFRRKKDYKVSELVDPSILTSASRQIEAILYDISKDTLIAQHAFAEYKEGVIAQISSIAPLGHSIHSSLTVSGLLELSNMGKQLYETLEPLAGQASALDSLTGLYTSYLFETITRDRVKRYLDGIVEGAHMRNIGLAVIDLNYFKECNDVIGHPQANIILKAFALLLGQLPGVVAARPHGDEFYILKDGRDVNGLQAIFNALIFDYTHTLKQTANGPITDLLSIVRNIGNGECTPALEEFVLNQFSISVGVTSTRLDPSTHVFKRVLGYLPPDEHGETLRRLLPTFSDESFVYGGLKRKVEPYMPVLEHSFYLMLRGEAEDALKNAKKIKEYGKSKAVSYGACSVESDHGGRSA